MLRHRVISTLALLAMIGLIGVDFFLPVPPYLYLTLAFSWFLITLGGSFLIRWNYHLPSLHANRAIEKPLVSITFDDGPHPEFTPKVLALLRRYDAKATFFCIGQEVEKHPNILTDILAEGHTVGNHTYSHSKLFGFFGLNKVTFEMKRTNTVVQALSGLEMKLYRPAFGVTNPTIKKAVRDLGLFSIGWNIRSLDTTSRSKAVVLKRITSRVSRGDIILLHDTSEKTVGLLEQLLLFLREKKLRSVPVDQLLKIQAYA